MPLTSAEPRPNPHFPLPPPSSLPSSLSSSLPPPQDLFKAKAQDVGELQAVVVCKDNSGLGGDWHLQSVEVWHPELKKRYFFVCNDWFKVGV